MGLTHQGETKSLHFLQPLAFPLPRALLLGFRFVSLHSFTWQASSECQALGCAPGMKGNSHSPYLEAQNGVPRKDPSHRGGDEGRQASFPQPGKARCVPDNAPPIPSGKEHRSIE